MSDAVAAKREPLALPAKRQLYFGGGWRAPRRGGSEEVISPGTGATLTTIAVAGADDVDPAVEAARAGFRIWRGVPPLDRARILREVSRIVRANARELALLDAADSGNPVALMLPDAEAAAAQIDFFAGLVTEMKGSSVPMALDRLNFSVREPVGVVARILPFNHPLLFCAGKTASILAAGNAVIVKPAEQTPLTALRFAELVGHLYPAGVFNVLPGGRDVAAALAVHPDIAAVALIGSVAAGRAVMRAAAETIKPVLLELGGKNALIAFPDADPDEVSEALIAGMNFGWCGQSCGSTSRAFIHADIYDQVIDRVPKRAAVFQPGIPTDLATTMGAIVSRRQWQRVQEFIASGTSEGARLLCGGTLVNEPGLTEGFFIQPTIFADVTPKMRIAREEIFGPVLSILPWRNEAEMIGEVNGTDYGLTCSIWTNDLDQAHRMARAVEAGFVWINETARHFVGAPFGGYKQSGLGREECLAELLAFTQEKNIHIKLRC